MPYHEIWRLLRDTFLAWLDDRAPSMGAALAFYTLFSLVPLSIIVIAIAGVFFGPQAAEGQLVAQIQGLIGKQGATTIQAIIESARNPMTGLATVIVGLATLFITATTVFVELKNSLDHIWGVRAPSSRGMLDIIETRLLSFSMIVIIGLLLLASLAVSTALTAIEQHTDLLPEKTHVVAVLNFVLFCGTITVLFAAIYKLLPDISIAWKDVWIGAALTALLFTLGKSVIALYLAKTPITSAFGAAGSAIAGLLWVYYSAQIFFLGAEFTKLYARRYGSHKALEARTASSAEARSG